MFSLHTVVYKNLFKLYQLGHQDITLLLNELFENMIKLDKDYRNDLNHLSTFDMRDSILKMCIECIPNINF